MTPEPILDINSRFISPENNLDIVWLQVKRPTVLELTTYIQDLNKVFHRSFPEIDCPNAITDTFYYSISSKYFNNLLISFTNKSPLTRPDLLISTVISLSLPKYLYDLSDNRTNYTTSKIPIVLPWEFFTTKFTPYIITGITELITRVRDHLTEERIKQIKSDLE